MTSPDPSPRTGAQRFLAANGWGGADVRLLAADASFRSYWRVSQDGRTAVLMDAPPEKEALVPFLAIASFLGRNGFRAPQAEAVDLDEGFALLEDFGDRRMNPLLLREPRRERELYTAAVRLLAKLHRVPLPHRPAANLDFELRPYGSAELEREIRLFTEWYMPAVDLPVDDGLVEAFEPVLAPVLQASARHPVLVLRDYHADNLMLLDDGALGLLDFQDGLAGHPAYDLVSLLQDARRDVSPDLEEEMLDFYACEAGAADTARFRSDYETLGAQRNIKILGIFARLSRRDGKHGYLAFQPRVWGYLERNFAHPALAPVKCWFDGHVPKSGRAAFWLERP